jgi:hypothetical protein
VKKGRRCLKQVADVQNGWWKGGRCSKWVVEVKSGDRCSKRAIDVKDGWCVEIRRTIGQQIYHGMHPGNSVRKFENFG